MQQKININFMYIFFHSQLSMIESEAYTSSTYFYGFSNFFNCSKPLNILYCKQCNEIFLIYPSITSKSSTYCYAGNKNSY